MDKLKFWKKEDDFDFDDLVDKDLGSTGEPLTDNLGLGRKPQGLNEKSPFKDSFASPEASSTSLPDPFQSTPSQYPATNPSPIAPLPPSSSNRDLELVNSKLDTVKALLNSIDQRLANVEQATGAGQRRKEQKLW